MREMFELNSKEKTLQEILRGLLILIFSLIAKGMYNDYNRLDENYILVPAYLIFSEIFCIIYIVNAFTNGNLVRKWASTPIFNAIFFFIKRNSIMTDDKALKLTTKIFGVFILIIAILLFIAGIIFYLF